MGFFLSLIGYLTALALVISGAVAGSMYMARPKPTTAQIEKVTEPGKRLQAASAALPKQQLPPKHALRRRTARRHLSRPQ